MEIVTDMAMGMEMATEMDMEMAMATEMEMAMAMEITAPVTAMVQVDNLSNSIFQNQ